MSIGELLDRDLILNQMDHLARKQVTGLIVKASLDSTNSALQRLPITQQSGTAILSERQTAGRGRRGRQWFSPKGGNLYLSLGWCFNKPLSELGCLPLVVALSAATALTRNGLQRHRIKWPNDLLLDGKKLSGCLIEVQGDANGPCHMVMGVGINIQMPSSEATSAIGQPWTDLRTWLPDCSRNRLAALLLEELIAHCSLFAEKGFTPFKHHWERLDCLKGQQVDVAAGQETLSGTVSGINDSGALLLDTGVETLSLHSGEVSIIAPC